MKKFLLIILALLLLPCLVLAEEDDDLLIEEIVEDVDLDAVAYGEVEWSFPIALEDMNPEYIRLANKHYLLESDYVPADLVKVPSKPASGGIYWAVQPKEGQLLRKESSQALCEMNTAIMAEAEANG